LAALNGRKTITQSKKWSFNKFTICTAKLNNFPKSYNVNFMLQALTEQSLGELEQLAIFTQIRQFLSKEEAVNGPELKLMINSTRLMEMTLQMLGQQG